MGRRFEGAWLALALLTACARVTALPDGTDLPGGPLVDEGWPDLGAADHGRLDAGRDLGPGDAGAPTLRFTEVAIEAGITAFQNRDPDTCRFGFRSCLAPHFAGGAAVGDVDGDGLFDLYLTALDQPGTLYRNLGDGTFMDITPKVDLDRVSVPTNGAAFADFDRDGRLDLYVTVIAPGDRIDRHLLYMQQPDGTFREESRRRGADLPSNHGRSGTSVAVGDYDRDGYVDLHVSEWLERDVAGPPLTRLLHNQGAEGPGVFDDVTRAAGVSSVDLACWDGATCDNTAFASAFTDLDADGWPDLLLVQDFEHSKLFWNDGDGTFTAAEGAGVGTDINGMGSTVGDYDNDGDLDWFVSGIGDNGDLCGDEPCVTGDTGNRLYRYVGGRRFDDATDLADCRMGGWGWGTALFDHDNDGDLDLVLTNGFDVPTVDYDTLWNRDRMRFWDNAGDGRFRPAGRPRGLTDRQVGTGLVVFDYDDDGDQDILVVVNQGRPLLYRNDGGNARSWLRVELEGRSSTPRGLGARVRLRAEPGGPWQLRELGSVTHFQGQSEPVAHFGLGASMKVVDTVEVRWPSGRVSVLHDVEADRRLRIVEPEP
ncbi:MAG: CRTAC1 family protein [Sandaracinaceae bacterium]